jgi:thiol:disulfide interchange protein DsbA
MKSVPMKHEVMRMLRRPVSASFPFAALVAALLLAQVARADLVEGKDYAKLAAAQPTGTPGKVEVIEFFSWGCPHCYEFQPTLLPWTKQLPPSVAFVRVPLSLGRREWGALSRAYYTLQSLGELARLDEALFDAIHKDGVRLFDEESLTVWASRHGVDPTKFGSEYNSAATTSKVMKAEQMARDYRVASVPTLTIGGQYVVLGHLVDGKDNRLVVAQQLVDRMTRK